LPLPIVVSVEDVTEMVAGRLVLDYELLTQRLDAWRTHHRQRSDVAVRERVQHCGVRPCLGPEANGTLDRMVPHRPHAGTPEPAQRVLLEVQERRGSLRGRRACAPGHVLGWEIDHQGERDAPEAVPPLVV
jgi:hypothetical protein